MPSFIKLRNGPRICCHTLQHSVHTIMLGTVSVQAKPCTRPLLVRRVLGYDLHMVAPWLDCRNVLYLCDRRRCIQTHLHWGAKTWVFVMSVCCIS